MKEKKKEKQRGGERELMQAMSEWKGERKRGKEMANKGERRENVN